MRRRQMATAWAAASLLICNIWSATAADSEPARSIERPAAVNAADGQYAVVAPIFTGADGNTSFIRLVNARGTDTQSSTPATTTYAISVVGSPSANVYGTANIQVATNASPQYSISEIRTLANAGALTGGDTAYALYIQNPDDGAGFMHVIYNDSNGFFENASVCQSYVQANTELKYLFNVHTTRLSAFPSQIYMHNYSNASVTYRVTVRDARTGTSIGSTNIVATANTTVAMPFSAFEQLLNWQPSADQTQANMSFEAVGIQIAPVLVGSFISNQRLGASVNMSSICATNNLSSSGSVGGGSTTTFDLTVSKIGNGFGTVTSAPAGLSCGFNCIYAFNSGASVTLTAAADGNSTFQGWGGACTGTGPCTVTMNSRQSVNATFARTTHALTVSKSGSGSGTIASSEQPGINCGSTCTLDVIVGRAITLAATPASGSRFTGWSGACSGTGICTVTMSAAQSVTAAFAPNFTLTVSKTGNGNVTSSPAGINCGSIGSECTAGFTTGLTVSLTALASNNSSFVGWSGCTPVSATNPNVCNVQINANTSVTANFSP